MSAANDAGPAFPVPLAQTNDGGVRHASEYGNAGMSLRDYFAAKALSGLIAEPQWREGSYSLCYSLGPQTKDDAANYAVAAYKLADAMLKARQA